MTPVLDTCFKHLGFLNKDMSDIQLLKDIVKHEMYLDTFEPFQPIIEPFLAHSVSLNTMYDDIKKGILTNHGPLLTFAEQLVRSQELQKITFDLTLMRRIAHRIFILNLLVQTMVNTPTFLVELQRHYSTLRHQLGGSTFVSVYRATKGPFETAKILTVDTTITQYLEFRSQSTSLTLNDLRRKNKGLFLNILEATVADAVRGFKNNAFSGMALGLRLVNHLDYDPSNKMVIQQFNSGWDTLYESWNLAFVAGKIGDSEYLMPKLLIPCLLNAKPEHYLFIRGIALWASAHMLLFHRLQTGMPDTKVNPLMTQLSLKLGEINIAYAHKFFGDGLQKGVLKKYAKKIWEVFVA